MEWTWSLINSSSSSYSCFVAIGTKDAAQQLTARVRKKREGKLVSSWVEAMWRRAVTCNSWCTVGQMMPDLQMGFWILNWPRPRGPLLLFFSTRFCCKPATEDWAPSLCSITNLIFLLPRRQHSSSSSYEWHLSFSFVTCSSYSSVVCFSRLLRLWFETTGIISSSPQDLEKNRDIEIRYTFVVFSRDVWIFQIDTISSELWHHLQITELDVVLHSARCNVQTSSHVCLLFDHLLQLAIFSWNLGT